MVTNPRAALRPHRLRPLNLPQKIEVRTDTSGKPTSIVHRGQVRMVALVRDEWRVNDEWWRDPIARRYVEIISTDGARIVIYEDFIHDGWFLQYTDTSHNIPVDPS